MAVYRGPEFKSGQISLSPPGVDRLTMTLATADIAEAEKSWFERSRSDQALLYFSVSLGGKLIGQIFLHDMNPTQQEAMVGYHIFDAERRGKGYGTAALEALCQYAFHELCLNRLIIITSLGNTASRRIAEKCDFQGIGPAREGPDLIVYERLGTVR